MSDSDHADDVAVAIVAAERWLALADADDVAGSLAASSAVFRAVVSEEQWLASLQRVRGTLGAVVEREYATSRYTTEVPGAPDGEYVILEYSTQLERKKEAVETVVMMRDPDGEWRVGGYFVK